MDPYRSDGGSANMDDLFLARGWRYATLEQSGRVMIWEASDDFLAEVPWVTVAARIRSVGPSTARLRDVMKPEWRTDSTGKNAN